MNPLHLFLLLGVIIVWGVTFVVIKTGLQEGIPPVFLCFTRFLFCLPALFFIKRPLVPMKKIATYSLVMFVFQFCFLFIGMRSGITAGLASVLLQFQSFFAIGFAVIFLREKFYFWQGIGACVAFLGILLVAAHIGGGDVTLGGLCLVLSAAIMWAGGSFLAKKMDRASGLPLVVWSSALACPLLLLVSLFLEGPERIADCIRNFSWIHFASISYIAYFSTLFGFGVWNWLLRSYPLSKISPFTLLVPIVGMLGSSLFLGEPLHWWKITSAGLILIGLSINFFAARVRSVIEPEKPETARKNVL